MGIKLQTPKPSLSVVLLSYQHHDTIQRCLDSILLSTCADVELIIIDDGSTDGTVEKIENWIDLNRKWFLRLAFIPTATNKGTVDSIVTGVSISNAAYIKCIAGDDFFLAHALDKLKEYVRHHDFDVAFTPLEVIKSADFKVSGNLPPTKSEHFFNHSIKKQYQSLVFKNHLYAPGAFFTRDFWNAVELQHSGLVLVEDWYMWLKGLSLDKKYVYCPEYLVVYRQSNNSVSHNAASPNFKKYLKDISSTLSQVLTMRKEWIAWYERAMIRVIQCGLDCIILLPLGWICAIDKIRRFFWNPSKSNKDQNAGI